MNGTALFQFEVKTELQGMNVEEKERGTRTVTQLLQSNHFCVSQG